MNVFVRRAFALLLLGGAVGASLALPAIFDGSQLASRGPLPTGTNPTTTQVRVSYPTGPSTRRAARRLRLGLSPGTSRASPGRLRTPLPRFRLLQPLPFHLLPHLL
jgi:hypothetical protein